MTSIRYPIFLALLGLSLGAQAESIYLCKAYAGGMFWAKSHCNQNSALIERIASVPDSLPFTQQVAIAEQQRNAAAQASMANTSSSTTYTQTGPDKPTECKALNAQIQHYDSMARQPQSGQMQDWISARRKTVRDRQFKIQC